jgi:phosphohistidine phosphatase
MKVYLVQHAEAEPEELDPTRPLTRRGRQDVKQIADLAERLRLDVQQIRHSGKARAEQTATALGEAISPSGGVVAAPGLGPTDDVRPTADELNSALQSLMPVGHLPFLERLTGQLLLGDSNQSVVQFNNAGVVCLERENGRWQVAWIVTPAIAYAWANQVDADEGVTARTPGG